MFRNILYFDKNKVEQYMFFAQAQKGEKPKDYSFSNSNTAICLLMCSDFENSLLGRDDFFDFADRESTKEIKIDDVKSDCIIKFNAEIRIPEEFDLLNLFDVHKDWFLSLPNYNKTNSEDESEIIKEVLSSSKHRIPIFCDLDEKCGCWLGVSKALSENLLIDYDELVEYEGITCTIIAKIESKVLGQGKELKVFDVCRDFFMLNRAFRKQAKMNFDDTIKPITVNQDYLSLELLTIYKKG